MFAKNIINITFIKKEVKATPKNQIQKRKMHNARNVLFQKYYNATGIGIRQKLTFLTQRTNQKREITTLSKIRHKDCKEKGLFLNLTTKEDFVENYYKYYKHYTNLKTTYYLATTIKIKKENV